MTTVSITPSPYVVTSETSGTDVDFEVIQDGSDFATPDPSTATL